MTNLRNKRAVDVTAGEVLPRKAYFVADYRDMLAAGDRAIGTDAPIHSFSFVDYTELPICINTMLINVAYNYTLNVGDTFLFSTELKGDENDTEFILEVDSKGLFCKDILTCAEIEEYTNHCVSFDVQVCRVKL